MSKKTTVSGILLVLLVLATTPLLGTDNVSFLKWWLMTLVLGIGFYPAAAALFPRFHDRGWMFSKVLGIVVSGFAVFALGSFGLVPFTAPVCLITVGVLILASWIFGCFKVRVHAPEIDFLMMEEVLFFAFFLLWTYLAGFHPEAHGTEKFMDYGFMKAMMRSTAVPAEDLWYSGSGINYYYGGQFYAVFLTKITFTDVKQTYHLTRTMVASFAFVLPFSITYHLAESRACHCIRKEGGNKSQIAPVLGGLLSGGAVSLAGNMHYVIYGCIRQWLGLNESAYWFPSSTRYIGYDPLVENDRTIHEFPSYSFVLGDLHAHVVNVMFVLLVLGLLYSYVKNTCRDPEKEWKWSLKDVLLQPQIIAAGFLIGVFHWSNYWDFVIYFVVIAGFALYGALYRYHARAKETIGTVLLQAAEVFAIGTVVALPFTMKFETMVSGVGIAKHHSILYQLAILWGLPTVLVVLFIAAVLLAWRKNCHLPGMERQGQIVLADGKTQEEVEERYGDRYFRPLCHRPYHHSGARLCARYLRRIVCALQHDVQADVSGIYPVRYLHELHHHAVPALEKRADSAGVRRNRAGTAFMDVRLFWNERVLLVRKCFRSVRVPRTRCDSVSGKCLFRGRRCHPLAG